jgi:Protein of unknown function (DUF2971)
MKLYKYTAVNENSLSILIHSHLWFADPRSFNDPFDVDLHIYYQTNYQKAIKFADNAIKTIDEVITNLSKKIEVKEDIIKKSEQFILSSDTYLKDMDALSAETHEKIIVCMKEIVLLTEKTPKIDNSNIDDITELNITMRNSIKIVIEHYEKSVLHFKELHSNALNDQLEITNKKTDLINEFHRLNQLQKEQINIKNRIEEVKRYIEKQKYYDAIGVLSLSKENSQSNTLMWSHYGDSHRGIALEFDTKMDTDFFKKITNVIYSDDSHAQQKEKNKKIIKKIAPHLADTEREQGLLPVLFSKSTQWEYEKEVRLIKADIKDNQRLFKYRPECLTGVYFGLNTTEEHKKMIQTIIHLKGLTKTVPFYQAEKVPNAFTLNYKKISIED